MKKLTKVFAYMSFVFAFCFLAIGYAAVQDTLLVEGSISVQAANKIFAVYGEAFDSNGDSIGKALNFYNRPAVQINDTITLLNDDGTMTYGTQTVEVIYENIDTAAYTSQAEVPWSVHNTSVDTAIKTMRVVDEGIAPSSTAYWFAQKGTGSEDVNELHTINVAKLDTSNVTSMEGMFAFCKKVTYIDLSSFNTLNVDNMKHMFRNCFGLTQLNLDRFDTKNVIDMEGMFWSCNQLTELNVNHFNTSNVENMKNLFRNCQQFTKLDLSSFNTEKVTRMDGMFTSCANLKTLDLSGFDTRNVTDMGQMFHCPALERIYVSENWTTESVRSMTGMGAMFASSVLVGGAGSTASNAGTGLSAARIDGGTSAPGLLTYKHYALVFYQNHDGASNVPTMVFSETNTIALPNAEHAWATFLGWATTADATVPEYTGDTFTTSSATPYCDVLYAVWSGLGATTPEDLEEDAQEPDAGTSPDNPLIIGGGEWSEFGDGATIDNIIDGHHLKIYDGNFGGEGKMVVFYYPNDAVITIEGGSFTANYLVAFSTNFTLNINGGVFNVDDLLLEGSGGVINITGGIFNKDPRNYWGNANIGSGCTVQENSDGTWSVVKAE